MNEIITEPGTPIYDFTGEVIWAFFKQKMVSNGMIKFHNVSQLLGIPTIEETPFNPPLRSNIQLHLYFNTSYNKWMAGNGVVQKDFEDCEYFYINRMHGVQNSYEALEYLLNDTDFLDFIKSISMVNDDIKQRLSYYLEILDHRRR